MAAETRGAPPSLDAGQPQKPEQSIEQGPDNTPTPLPTADRRKLRWAGIVAVIVFAAILAIGTATRVIARQNLHRTTQSESQLSVTAVHPTLIHGTTLTLPARLDAWTEAPVYARTDGYLLHWYADIGTPVHAGTVLADIDTPEVNQQLAASRAALATRRPTSTLPPLRRTGGTSCWRRMPFQSRTPMTGAATTPRSLRCATRRRPRWIGCWR